MDNLDLFLEAYYGKLPEFAEIENCLAVIQEKARKEKKKSNPNKYPENAKMCKLFARIFGLKKMILYWVPSDTLNAFTTPIYSLMLFGESKDFVEKRSDKGFYDTSGRSVFTVYVYTGTLSETADLTPGELVSLILHELGHNFDYSRYHLLDFTLEFILCPFALFSYVREHDLIEDQNIIKLDTLIDIKDEFEPLYKDPERRMREDQKYKRNLERYINCGYIRRMLRVMSLGVSNTMSLLMFPVTLLTQFFNLGGKKGELFADSFAVSYGYGSELISALGKLGNNHGVTPKGGPFMDLLRDLEQCNVEMTISMLEIHGTDQERCKSAIKKLESDLRKGEYPPELREELYEELDKIKKRYVAMTTYSKDEKYKITKAFRKLYAVLFGGALNIEKLFPPNRV